MFRFNIGSIEVTKIDESLAPAAEPFTFLEKLPADALARNRAWLEPLFYDAAEAKLILSGHAWLIKTPAHAILIEACAGNHKSRPGFARGDMLNTPWLDRLAEAGCRPEDIDFVLCTHLHVDHVGWFTRIEDGQWVPTFPNAKYLIDRIEYDNWNPATRTLPAFSLNENAFEDSVAPVMARGLMALIDPPFVVDAGVEIIPARGHTLGHAAISIDDGDKRALFVGDAMHTPLQIAYPDCPTYSCEDKAATVATHYALLARCADEDRLFVPTHFPEPFSAVRIVRVGDRFGFTDIEGTMPTGLAEALVD